MIQVNVKRFTCCQELVEIKKRCGKLINSVCPTKEFNYHRNLHKIFYEKRNNVIIFFFFFCVCLNYHFFLSKLHHKKHKTDKANNNKTTKQQNKQTSKQNKRKINKQCPLPPRTNQRTRTRTRKQKLKKIKHVFKRTVKQTWSNCT